MIQQPPNEVLDVHEFKRKMCEYLRRLQAGEVELLIRRYGKPIAVVLSTEQMRIRTAARDAEHRLRVHLAALRRQSMQRRRILIATPEHAGPPRSSPCCAGRRFRLRGEMLVNSSSGDACWSTGSSWSTLTFSFPLSPCATRCLLVNICARPTKNPP